MAETSRGYFGDTKEENPNETVLYEELETFNILHIQKTIEQLKKEIDELLDVSEAMVMLSIEKNELPKEQINDHLNYILTIIEKKLPTAVYDYFKEYRSFPLTREVSELASNPILSHDQKVSIE